MNVFVICPVRNITPSLERRILEYVKTLEEQGVTVHYPTRDTDQNDTTGFRICQDNRRAILLADEVHVVFDGDSQGRLFDLGMAFAMNKRIKIAPLFNNIDENKGKSFIKMVTEWEKKGDTK